MVRRRGVGFLVAALALVVSVGCSAPPRGALYQRFVAAPTSTPAGPNGASLAQYYTLGAFRVGDQLAAASNALDDGLIDRQQGLISAAYLRLIAQRSDQAAASAVAEAQQLTPPPEIRSQADTFFAASVALAAAVGDTQQALAAPAGVTSSQLLTATQHRQTAAQALENVMSALEAMSWGQPAASRAP
jgi:hypothetical protein